VREKWKNLQRKTQHPDVNHYHKNAYLKKNRARLSVMEKNFLQTRLKGGGTAEGQLKLIPTEDAGEERNSRGGGRREEINGAAEKPRTSKTEKRTHAHVKKGHKEGGRVERKRRPGGIT